MTDYLIYAIIGMVILILLTVFAYFVYSGLFTNIEIRTGKPPIGAVRVAYKYEVGPYKNCGTLFTEVTKAAPDLRCFGVYYDDPSKVAGDKQRYIVGVVLGSPGDKDENKELEEKLVKEEGFKTTTFPEVNHMVMTTFPEVNSLSIVIAVQRVYPVFGDYIVQNGLCAHPVIEMYANGDIHFLAPLAKQNEFYVPECGEETSSNGQSSKTESSNSEDETKDDQGTATGGEQSSSEASSFEELNVNDSDLNVNEELNVNEA